MAAKLIYLTDEEFDLLAVNLNFGSTTSDKINLNHKLVFMRDMYEEKEPKDWRDTNKGSGLNEMPTKHKMTRAEAKACFLKHMPRAMDGHAEDMVDFYIEAGMLEIVEEKSHREKFRQACSDLGHDEATVFGHWALKAYDTAHDTKF